MVERLSSLNNTPQDTGSLVLETEKSLFAYFAMMNKTIQETHFAIVN